MIADELYCVIEAGLITFVDVSAGRINAAGWFNNLVSGSMCVDAISGCAGVVAVSRVSNSASSASYFSIKRSSFSAAVCSTVLFWAASRCRPYSIFCTQYWLFEYIYFYTNNVNKNRFQVICGK